MAARKPEERRRARELREVLDFDHVGAKTGCVVELARRGYSLRRLEKEVSQCEIRCANCHRRRHVELPEAA
jgi:L-lysine 2,3-aminomutase